MGHGFIEYRGGAMLNCHEGISGYIGERLHELSLSPEFNAIVPAVSAWREALEMPPGCSAIRLDETLADERTRWLFIEALTEVHAALEDDQPRTKEQVRQLIAFLELGEASLKGCSSRTTHVSHTTCASQINLTLLARAAVTRAATLHETLWHCSRDVCTAHRRLNPLARRCARGSVDGALTRPRCLWRWSWRASSRLRLQTPT